MGFILTPKLVTDALGQFASRQQPVGLHRFALGMDPTGFYRVEPGAFGGQGTGQDADSFPFPLDSAVVGLYPAPPFLAKGAGGGAPHQEQRLLAQSLQLATDPRQESGGHPTDGATLHKAQPHFLLGWGGRGLPAHHKPIAGQGFGFWGIFGNRVRYQPPGTTYICPGVQAGVSQSAKPALIFKAQGPVRRGGCQTDQAVPNPFFRAYWPAASAPLSGPG